MLSHDAWLLRFGADERVVGSSVTFGERTYDIIGVLPKGFFFPSWLVNNAKRQLVTVMPPVRPGAEGGAAFPVVRLEPGVSLEEAQFELSSLVAPIAARRGEPNMSVALSDVRAQLYPTGQTAMRFLLLASCLVLLLGCANLANLLLLRTRRREREVGVRAALGASHSQILRPLICESLLLGLLAAAVAVGLTKAIFGILVRQIPPAAYATASIGVDARVLVVAIGLGLISGVVFVALPAWRAAHVDPQSLILQRYSTQGGRRQPLDRLLIAVQVALSIVLVFGAAVVGHELQRVLSVPLGFDPTNVLLVEVSPRGLQGLDRRTFYANVLAALAQRRNVIATGAAGTLPLSGGVGDEPVWTPESKAGGVEANLVHVLPGYFDAVGLQLLRGRLLNQDDLSRESAVVISSSAARTLFGDRDPLGGALETHAGRRLQVVGIVADIATLKPDESAPPLAYAIPHEETRRLTLLTRMRSREDPAASDIRRTVGGLAPNTVVTTRWWEDSIDASMEFRNPRFQTTVLGSLAALALGLTALGVFSVVAFWVASRTREVGIRLAVGASPRSLVRLILHQALMPVAAGIFIGLAGAAWLRPLAQAQFFKAEVTGPYLLISAVAVVFAAACLAAYLPARRATGINPLVVLREE